MDGTPPVRRSARARGPNGAAVALGLLVAAAFAVHGLAGVPRRAAAEVARAGRDPDARALARLARPPLGLPRVPLPGGRRPTTQQVALGRKLFFDRRLSFNGTMSCGMCHVPEQGFTNNELATPIGVAGRSLKRNAPTVLNVAYLEHVFLDGRERTLESQVLSPLLARNEMAVPAIGWLLARLDTLDDYRVRFQRAFGGGPSIERLGAAIAAWERTLLAGNSRFDRWRYGGDPRALDARERRGFELFTGRAGCVPCHRVDADHALFTDHSFHDTGIGYHGTEVAPRDERPVMVEIAPGRSVPVEPAVLRSVGDPPEPDLGRHEVTLDDADKWRFRTPSLRNVALTAPYMHDGSLRTLEDVVRFYDRGGIPHAGLDSLVRPLGLGDDDVEALVAFLRSLTSEDVAELRADARSAGIGR